MHRGGGYAAAELLEQPTLARARRTEDRRHHRTPLGLDDPPELEQLLELKLPTDERCAGNRALGDVLLDAADVPNFDRLGFTLRADRIGGLEIDRLRRSEIRPLVHEHSALRGGRLDSSGRVHDVAPRHSLALGDTSTQCDQRLAGVDSDSNLEPPRRVLLVEDLDFVEDREAGANRAFLVVLVCDRCAEDGHDGVADELLDCSTVALERRAEPRVVRLEQGANVLGIELFAATRRADHVHEEHRDLLALLLGRRLLV